MIINKYLYCAIGLMIFVLSTFIIQFYFRLGYEISDKPSDWVDFSDYIAGTLGPLLSFLSFVLLLKSLNLQREANEVLILEYQQNRKNEKFSSFETHFFNLIESQRNSFSNFKYVEQDREFFGVSGVNCIEDLIETKRANGASTKEISEWLDSIDDEERIYNVIRVFYNLVKVVCDRLSDENGFDSTCRKQQMHSLSNLTEFSQLRLVVISMQFMDEYYPIEYLKNNDEFISVLKELKLPLSPY